MRLRFVRRAADDLAAIADFLREISPGAGMCVRAAIHDALADLLVFPHAGRQQSEEGVRKFVTPRYGYLIYYLVDEEAGEIGVAHEVMDRLMQPVLIVKKGLTEILIPLAEGVVKNVDRANKVLHIAAPAGLIDLYLAKNEEEE